MIFAKSNPMGENQTMARGGYGLGAGRPRKSPPALPLPKAVKRQGKQTPLEYMLSVMNDPLVEPSRRDRRAIAAAPYLHARASEQKPGKKQVAEQAAQSAGEGSDWGDDLAPAVRLS
jgi:hypothetical protein